MKTNFLNYLYKFIVIFTAVFVFSGSLYSDSDNTGDESVEFEQLIREKQWDKALVSAQKIIENYPDNRENRFKLAFVYIQLKEYEKAVEILQDIIKEESGYVQAYVQLSIAYRMMGKPEKALNIIEQGVDAVPNHYLLKFNYGICLMAANKIDEAINAFNEFAMLVPMRKSGGLF